CSGICVSGACCPGPMGMLTAAGTECGTRALDSRYADLRRTSGVCVYGPICCPPNADYGLSLYISATQGQCAYYPPGGPSGGVDVPCSVVNGTWTCSGYTPPPSCSYCQEQSRICYAGAQFQP